MTVRDLIEKLKEFPEDMMVMNYEYLDIYDVTEDEVSWKEPYDKVIIII